MPSIAGRRVVMRVRLKGINHITKTLADGTKRAYYYAWKGGPRLEGEPGSPEFIASYDRAIRQKVQPAAGTVARILAAYQDSAEWAKLADRTRKDYLGKILLIEKEFGSFPLEALNDRRTRGMFMSWRDKLAKASPRQADLAWSVLARVLSWSFNRGLVDTNPCKGGGRLYDGGSRKDRVWTDADEAAFLAVAGDGLKLAFLLAVYTGQRQGDLLRLPWNAYDGRTIRLRQGKTGVRVAVPVHSTLRSALDAAKRISPIILTARGGVPWTADGFRSSWRKACQRAAIEGLTFHDLRGTAVTRLFEAQCTDAEVATITGHSLSEVRSILDANYFSRSSALAQSAIEKLETRTKKSNRLPNRAAGSSEEREKV
ncbi:tyrosine-type recombinase/integrase [Fulvimarina sp. MAC3]|uniref:tyrosine-type recombinase/integrase n=1 Tax=Fulvimarina sp. MAC3 TaxID=3148887 RepID=UPI0031FBD2A6